ncbi:MAG TPA: flagellar hook basal-body protein [Allosphingosinicella sp.]|jgi:flagellar basal-body rod protein FlgG
MDRIAETAATILQNAERRVEVSAQNITNAATPGYKRRVSFAHALASPGVGNRTFDATVSNLPDFTAGKEILTGNPTDLAIMGQGFFAVRADDEVLYTRQGQFRRDEEGRLVTGEGMALQASGGGDVVVPAGTFSVAADGMVTVAGQPVARVAVVDFADRGALRPAQGSAFAAGEVQPDEVQGSVIRQGMLESSNVSTGDEMVAMMEALRRAESGQRLISVYDDLMGRALTTFGEK